MDNKLDVQHQPSMQPDGTYRFALGAVTDPDNLSSNVNELGNSFVAELGSQPMGSISISNMEKVIFTADGSIFLLNDRTLTLIVKKDFNFNYPVKGEYRLLQGCKRIIYWQDDLNPDRWMDIDNPLEDLEEYNLIYNFIHPKIASSVLQTGGDLEYGNYYFAAVLMDNDKNELFTSPISIDYTPITTGQKIGARNISNILADVGGKPKSNQSINVSITNIDTKAKFLKIIVFRNIGESTTDTHVIGNIIPVDGDTVNYVYTGFNIDNGDFIDDPYKYNFNFIPHQVSKKFQQVQNRLVRFNVKENNYDYDEYQKFASKICSKYVINQFSKFDPQAYLKNQSFPSGKVFSKAIVYVHKDGSLSPAFPIAGRAKIMTDGVQLSIANTTNTIAYNLFSINYTPIQGVAWSFQMNYQFSQIVDNMTINLEISDGVTTDEVPMFFTNGLGGLNVLGAIVPTQYIGYNPTAIKIYSNGLLVGTISLDAWTNGGDLSGEIILDGAVTHSIETWQLLDTTIKDPVPIDGYIASGEFGYYENGQLYKAPPNSECVTDYWGNDCDGNALENTPVRFDVFPTWTNESMMDINGNLSTIGIWFDETTVKYPNANVVGHYFVISEVENSNIISKGFLTKFNSTKDNEIEEGFYLEEMMNNSNTYNYISADVLVGENYVNGDYVVKEGELTITPRQDGKGYNDIFHGDLPYTNLNIDLYERLILDYTLKNQDFYAIDNSSLITPNSIFDDLVNNSFSNNKLILDLDGDNINNFTAVAVKTLRPVLQNIYSIRYRRITELNEYISFNGEHFINDINIDNIAYINVDGRNFIQTLLFQDANISAKVETILGIPLESKYNLLVRHNGTNVCNTYFNEQEVFDYFLPKLTEEYQDDKLKMRDSICTFYPAYNHDYSKLQTLNLYHPLDQIYNYCLPCNGIYPTDIVWSEVSQSTETQDYYRIYKANNKKSLSAHRGEIIDADYKAGRLFIRCVEGCFILSPNPKSMQVDGSNVYIGTGSFLALPEAELNINDLGYGGQTHASDSHNCERGLIWIDNARKKVHIVEDNVPRELNREGLYNWFFDNLTTGESIISYDPYYERLMITHKDHWTLSYCFKVGGWKSWHSYIPQFYLYNQNHLYTVYLNTLYLHDGGNGYNNYYNIQFPFIIEFIITNKFEDFHLSAIYYNSKVEGSQLTETFDQIQVYNDLQNSGIQDLVMISDNEYGIDDSVYVARSNTNFKISGVADMSESTDNHSLDITTYKKGVNQGYIDKLPVVNYLKEQVERGRFNDKYAAVRLFYNGNKKHVFNLIHTLNSNNVR